MYTKKFIKNFLKSNNCGIMFHHFNNSKTKKVFNGSFTEIDLENLIHYVGLQNISSPEEFLINIEGNSNEKKCCITFDDGLKSQKKVALPILKKYNIKAFWFIYTSTFEEDTNDNEVNKYLINKNYSNYNKFLKDLKEKLSNIFPEKRYKFDIKHDEDIKFFSLAEREHRFIRDKFLSDSEYNFLIKEIFLKKNNLSSIKKKLFLNKKDLNNLLEQGHHIGLHSHSHPMNITKLSYKQQLLEYAKCKDKINALTSSNLICMSHPNNYYNENTLKVLKKLGIKYGFHSQKFERKKSNLEIPRIDCSYLK